MDSVCCFLQLLLIYQTKCTRCVYMCVCVLKASASLAVHISQSRDRTCCLSGRRVAIVTRSASLRCFWETVFSQTNLSGCQQQDTVLLSFVSAACLSFSFLLHFSHLLTVSRFRSGKTTWSVISQVQNCSSGSCTYTHKHSPNIPKWFLFWLLPCVQSHSTFVLAFCWFYRSLSCSLTHQPILHNHPHTHTHTLWSWFCFLKWIKDTQCKKCFVQELLPGFSSSLLDILFWYNIIDSNTKKERKKVTWILKTHNFYSFLSLQFWFAVYIIKKKVPAVVFCKVFNYIVYSPSFK